MSLNEHMVTLVCDASLPLVCDGSLPLVCDGSRPLVCDASLPYQQLLLVHLTVKLGLVGWPYYRSE